jgi:hypothetical protein
VPKLHQELRVFEAELRVLQGKKQMGKAEAYRQAEDLDSPKINKDHVYKSRLAVYEAKKKAEDDPTPQNERQYKAALIKLKLLEITETKSSLKFVASQIEELRMELVEMLARTTEQKRQASCKFSGWWDKLRGPPQYTCMAKDCREPQRWVILKCPDCGLLWCPACHWKLKTSHGTAGTPSADRGWHDYQLRAAAYKPIL